MVSLRLTVEKRVVDSRCEMGEFFVCFFGGGGRKRDDSLCRAFNLSSPSPLRIGFWVVHNV